MEAASRDVVEAIMQTSWNQLAFRNYTVFVDGRCSLLLKHMLSVVGSDL